MNVLVIDKSALISERLVVLVKDAENIEAVYTASAYAEAIVIMEQVRPDIVLLDMNMPALRSIDIVKKIKKDHRTAALIVLFNHVNEIKKQYCDFLGVHFIFDKYHDIEKIIPAINSLTTGKQKVNPAL